MKALSEKITELRSLGERIESFNESSLPPTSPFWELVDALEETNKNVMIAKQMAKLFLSTDKDGGASKVILKKIAEAHELILSSIDHVDKFREKNTGEFGKRAH